MKHFIRSMCVTAGFMLCVDALAQPDTLVLQPNAGDGIDASVHSKFTTTNYETHPAIRAINGTHSGDQYTTFSYIKFDMSLPQNAIVLESNLILFGNIFSQSGTGSNAAYLRKVVQDWDETTLIYTNRPNATATGQISLASSTSVINDTMDVTNHVQEFIRCDVENYGWELRLQTSNIYAWREYFSSDYTTDTTKRPKLVIVWVLPMSLSAFNVTHASEDADNGAIDITMANGVPPYSYSWTGPNSFSSSNEDVSNLEPGVYYLNVTDDEGYEFYTYFLVGKACRTVTAVLQPDANYAFDAIISDYDSCDNFKSVDYFLSLKQFSDEGIVDILYNSRGLIQFPTQGLTSDFDIRSATLDLTGWAHDNSTESNASVLLRNTSSWEEASVNWEVQPTTTTTNQIALASSSSSTQNYSLDLTTHFQHFADNPSNNYGFMLKLTDETWSSMAYDVSTLLFYSSDNATSSNRPKLTIQYTLTCQPHAYLQDRIDGSYYIAKSGKLRFKYDEEYNDQDSLLTYRIFDTKRNVVVSQADIAKSVLFGDNRYEIDLSCDGEPLAQGFYTLEVINEKREKWYLRFYQEDDYSSCP